MKIRIASFLIVCSSFVLASCGSQDNTSSSDNDSSKQSNFDRALNLFSKFDLHLTNGFDYSVKQYYKSDVVNAETIKLRVNFDDGTQAKKITSSKKLNEFGQSEQFSFEETTTYFKNDQICEYDNGTWNWRAFDETEYLITNLSSFSVEEQFFINISESSFQKDLKFTADVPSNYIKNVLGNLASDFNDLKFTLTIKSDYSVITSFSFTYKQTYTNSEISFSSVFVAEPIDFPSTSSAL